jgi:hypothetical protein
MKTSVWFGLVLILPFLLLLPPASAATNDGSKLETLTVSAFTDGRDLLYITPTTIHWHHLDFALPGWWVDPHQPTYFVLQGSGAVPVQVVGWIPQWTCPPENPGCYGLETDSSTFLLGLPLPEQYQVTDVKVIRARYSLTVYQYPDAGNGYTTILDFNDDPPGGATWYKVQLTFAPLN